jgi:thiol-disulfide isomerase/thioredoxin
MKLISLIAALVFAQATKTSVEVRPALESYKGDVILLDFWATWCAPCRKQIPELISLYDRYKSRGVVVLGVSVDESPAAVEKFVKELHVNYPILLGGARDDLQQAFGPPGFPTLYIIDRSGQIRSQHTGLISMEEVERTVNLLL